MTSLPLILMLGCTPEEKTDTGAEEEAISGVETEGEEEENSESPTVTEADFWCYVAEVGDPVDQWSLSAYATDPQGNDTLKNFIPEGGSFQMNTGGEIAVIALVCTAEGLCTASATGSTIGASCAQAEQFQMEFYVEDEDGNRSTPMVLPGRQGASAEG